MRTLFPPPEQKDVKPREKTAAEKQEEEFEKIMQSQMDKHSMRPQWAHASMEDSEIPRPGQFSILYDKLPVTVDIDRESREISQLVVGTIVEVVEIAPEAIDQRIRARLLAPAGWISLRTCQADQPCQTIFAALVDADPLHAEEPEDSDYESEGDPDDPEYRPPGTRSPRRQASPMPDADIYGPDGPQTGQQDDYRGEEDLGDDGDEQAQDPQAGYAGELDEIGQRHGDGVQVFADGRRYSGQFDSNTFSGAAIMVWPDGHRYTGQYEYNQKHGEGYFLWPDGRFYDGQWKNGQRHGHGQYIAAESYVGEYYEGFRHGDGVLTWPDGKRYAGEFCRGALHGSAVMTWPDGRQYFGQYVDNLKEGEGVFHWQDGRLYEGQWHNGLRHGASRYIDARGQEHIGNWRKDRLLTHALAPEAGIKDPFCEAPVSLLSLRPKLKKSDTVKWWSDLNQGSRQMAEKMKKSGASVGQAGRDDAQYDIGRMGSARSMQPMGSMQSMQAMASAKPMQMKPVTPLGNNPTKVSERLTGSNVVSSGDVLLDIDPGRDQDWEEGSELQDPKGQPYVDYIPDDVHVVKIDGQVHPVYDLRHLRTMPLDALRSHADTLYDTFRDAIGSQVPDNDQGLLGWVYEVQARNLKPILDMALQDVRGGDPSKDFLVVAAPNTQDLDSLQVMSAPRSGPEPTLPEQKVQGPGYQHAGSSVASTERLMDNDFEDSDLLIMQSNEPTDLYSDQQNDVSAVGPDADDQDHQGMGNATARKRLRKQDPGAGGNIVK